MTTKGRSKSPASSIPGSIGFGELLPARFRKRENRFVVQVEFQHEVQPAHLANPGRLEELLVPGQKLWIHPVQNPNRKTQFDVVLVELEDTLVSVNSQLPNLIIGQALADGALSGFRERQRVRREVKRGHSRIDFVVEEAGNSRWLEIKSVTLVVNGTARFPDAPTLRGTRHLRELQEIVQNGGLATVIFVIQREDAQAFAPNDEMDPAFGTALRSAADAGVEVRAIRCTVTQQAITLNGAVPVCLDS